MSGETTNDATSSDLTRGHGDFYVDDKYVEHRCCWNSAIVRKCKSGEGQYGGSVALIAEVRKTEADKLCAAMNEALT